MRLASGEKACLRRRALLRGAAATAHRAGLFDIGKLTVNLHCI